MEILYVWFNKAASGVLDKTGVNLSPKYSFDVKYDGLYSVLYLRDWKGVENIFRNDVIENVTAIVGKNGTGKTSILKALQLLTCGTVGEITSAKYKHYYEERLQQSYRIIVLRDDTGIIKIYHNLRLFRNDTGFEVVDMTNDGLYGSILRNCTDFSDITKVYITNSSFGSAGGMGYAFSMASNRSEKRKDKIQIFKTLMTSRIYGRTPDSVNALNIIDIVYSDDKKVRAAWKDLNDKFRVTNPDQQHLKKIENAQYKLLETMANSLGYKDKITWETIQNPYVPVGMAQQIETQKNMQQVYYNTLYGVNRIVQNQG